jgi:pimeloyl-ACP methyl ester carboxylesterase
MPDLPLLSHTRVTAEGREPSRWLLVLHGIYGSGRNWGSLARRLVEERPGWGVLLVDLRLHGGSRDFPGPHTLQAAAEDVNRLVAALDFRAAAVLGHSFGGKVALSYAARHVDGLRQVWVVDSTLEVKEPAGSAWRIIGIVRSLPDRFSSRDELVDAMERHGYARPTGSWLAMNLERSDDGFRWRLDWEGVEEMLRDYFRTDPWGVIEHPPEGVEIHVVKATDSDAIDDADVARIEAAGRSTGRVHLHRVEGGHWLNTENPGAVLALLEEELE